jgi:hypothetical protein
LNERLQEIIHLHRLAEGDSPEAKLARLAASTALQSLLSAVAVGSCPTASATLTVTRVDGVLEQVRRQLDEPYRESLEVPALARHAGVSQKHLSRKFRAPRDDAAKPWAGPTDRAGAASPDDHAVAAQGSGDRSGLG